MAFLLYKCIQDQAAHAILPLTRFAPCIIGPRLVLNLREAYYLPFTEECNAPEINTQLFQEEFRVGSTEE